MTLTNDPDGTDLSPDDAELSLVSNLSVGAPGAMPESRSPAEQGGAPPDIASREVLPVPTPSQHGMSAEEVARLTGQDESSTDASNALDRAEGVTPDDED